MSIVWIVKIRLSKCFLIEPNCRNINKDPTFRRLSSLQQYLRKLKERKEISEEIYQRIQPQSRNLLKFRLIIDTSRTVYNHVGKNLSQLLNPLTSNEYTIKDSFGAVIPIKNFPEELFDQGYRFVSLDFVYLFTNMLLRKNN